MRNLSTVWKENFLTKHIWKKFIYSHELGYSMDQQHDGDSNRLTMLHKLNQPTDSLEINQLPVEQCHRNVLRRNRRGNKATETHFTGMSMSHICCYERCSGQMKKCDRWNRLTVWERECLKKAHKKTRWFNSKAFNLSFLLMDWTQMATFHTVLWRSW